MTLITAAESLLPWKRTDWRAWYLIMFLVPGVRAYRLLGQWFPTVFGTRNRFHGRQFSHGLGSRRECFGMIRARYIHCALYFYYVGSTSDHQSLDPGGGGLGTTILPTTWCFSNISVHGSHLQSMLTRIWFSGPRVRVCVSPKLPGSTAAACWSVKHISVIRLCCLVAKLCPTLCNTMDYNLPGFSLHGIVRERTLE